MLSITTKVAKPSLVFLRCKTQTSYHYASLFSLLNSPTSLFQLKTLHALLIVNGLFTTDRVLGSQLVKIYVDFCHLHQAFLVFQKLPNKTNIAWNAILKGLVDDGQFLQALELYHLMIKQSVIPDNFTYPIVLKACSGLSELEQGRRVLDTILLNETRHNTKRNIYVECAIINMFSKCGNLDKAREVFDEMSNRDLASWSAIICGSLHNGEFFEALHLFGRMRSEGLCPDSVIVAAILPACGRLEDKLMGMALQGCTVRSGFESELNVSNALIDMYCKCGDIRVADSIFSNMVYTDTVSWSTLIAGYSYNDLHEDGFGLYLEMKTAGVRTNGVIAASVLSGLAKLKWLKQGKEMHSYILKQGFEFDNVVGSALIDMYSSCGLMSKAQNIFEITSDRDITICNSMIVGYASNGDTDSIFSILQRFWKSKLRPNYVTIVSILPVCTRMGSLRLGKEIHGYATRSLATVVSVGNSLIDMYCKCGNLEMGLKVFNQMTTKNIVTYNTIISAEGTHGHGERAFSFFEQMKVANIQPNKVTFIALLSACSHAGLVDRAWLLYDSMIDEYHMFPDMEHYSCMVDTLGRAGHLSAACEFIGRISVEPDLNILGSLLLACRVHKKEDLADLVGKLILPKNLKDSGYHVLLSNIYASNKRWEDAMIVRKFIKDNGLIKKPGSSWIEVCHCIHMFHSSDVMHPEFRRIAETLENLSFDMKHQAYIQDPGFFV